MTATANHPPSPSIRLRELAWQLHLADYDNLSLPIDQDDLSLLVQLTDEDVSLLDGSLVFKSLEARNQLAAEHGCAVLNHALDDSERFIVANRLWRKEFSAKDLASGRLLALCHEQVDILASAAEVIQSGKIPPYDVLHAISAAIPYLSTIPVASLLALYTAQFEITQRDLAGDPLLEALEKRFREDHSLCHQILTAVRTAPTYANSSLYLIAALNLLTDASNDTADLIVIDANSNNAVLALDATRSLGRALKLGLLPSSHIDSAIHTILKNADHPDGALQRSAIFELTTQSLVNELCAQKVDSLLEERRSSALEATSYFLFSERESLASFERRDAWITALSALPADSLTALRHFDWILAQLIKSGEEKLAVEVLQRWILQLPSKSIVEDQVLSLIDATFREINQRQGLRNKLLTQWLIHNDLRLPKLASALISKITFEKHISLSFDADTVSSLDHTGLILLARRMLGYVIYEKPLLDLTFSLLAPSSANLPLPSLVKTLLIDEVGIDFPHETMTRVQAYAKEVGDEEANQLSNHVTTAINSYLEALHSLPKLAALKPSPRLAEAFAKAQARTMSRSREMAEEKSILRSLSTYIPLKAGRASFSYGNDGYTTAFPLQTHSVSITIPRRMVMDKIGHEISNFIYRLAQREEE